MGDSKATSHTESALFITPSRLPPVPVERLQRLEPYADAVLTLLALSHPDATLADLYDPDLMPVELRRAHRALDGAVDRALPAFVRFPPTASALNICLACTKK